ncbi:FAD linked oxidase domain protein (plasmid) [Rhizorhabdus wittichii RW1]|uniref:FAD linked oxidase domain protein n=1 Tax=Rhizorhabdus wittichii (strain DSM 6014 / CCUG 31198 / JCM 15750 / NBRC 105917 / EY 4224 / RW1) TaxID=392499 RepID=A0A9J9LHC6_RHIWR|nr:FAD-binding oxidoreductase [Sphingobium sp. LB126]ABQ71661.1 FAD linked oxidase domain protein [Rhizorhabdus wittichii RW1]PJG45538.1 FAD-binding oxidoreductase [Sphingobium sp. LB126]
MADIIELLRERLGEASVTLADEIESRHMSDWHVPAEPGTKPVALVRPRTPQEVSAVLAACTETRTPVVPQGGLTGLVGGATAIDGAVLLSLDRMREILELDATAGTITVEAGVPLQAIQEAADAVDLLYPLDIGSRGSCLIGGNVATNAGGNRVLRYGMTRDLVLGMEVVLADGTIVTTLNKMLKNNVGYDLKQFFIGSEGTLGVVTKVVLRLFPKPRSTATALCAFDDFDNVYAFLRRMRAGLADTMSSFEVMWPSFFEAALDKGNHRRPFAGQHAAYVLLEMMGTDPEQDGEHFEAVIGSAIEAGEVSDVVLAQSIGEADRFWAIRDMSGELDGALAPLVAFDISIETGRIAAFLDECERRCRERWSSARMYNFGHLADSNIHMFVTVEERPFPEHEIEQVIYECTQDWGGSISAEIGIGLLKRPYLAYSRSEAEIALMRRVKSALDPLNILNPTKVFEPLDIKLAAE